MINNSILGTTNLTYEAVQKHEAIQNFDTKTPKDESVKMDDDTISTASSYQTLQTFASDWTDCSNMSYSRFLKVFRSDSALHKEMLAILAAITEVIKENNGSETPAEYFCSLVGKIFVFKFKSIQLLLFFAGYNIGSDISK